MGRWSDSLKAWLPSVAVVCAVITASWYALAQRSLAEEEIRALSQIGSDLNDAAERTTSGALAPKQAKELTTKRVDLTRRLDESLKPGLVQAELMASAREAGLDVREVQPVGGNPQSGQNGSIAHYRHYRVLVRGKYSQIAEYMELCKKQRVPTRATEFRVAGVKDEQNVELNVLQAEITMEAFATQEQAARTTKETAGA